VQEGKPAFFIHTSGTGILTWEDVRAERWGKKADTPVYDDWEGVSTVTSLPDDAWHRLVDKIVLDAAFKGVKTAIVAPPTISGPGRGPGNQKSVQWYGMAKSILQSGKGFHVGEGGNEWTYIDVHDLSEVYLSLMEAAMESVSGIGDGKATWGKEGYYFAEAGDYRW
jgi:nucleoside-diphosphate-sugar epimerase